MEVLAMEVLAADEPRSLKNYWRALAASAMKSCLGAPQELAAVSLTNQFISIFTFVV
jgi:hypothetical protein